MATTVPSKHFQSVSSEVAEAYADCWDYDASGFDKDKWAAVAERRILNYRANRWLPRDEAMQVMAKFVPGYNLFAPSLMARLPEDSEVLLAREGSVCMYVRSPSKMPTAKRMKADERNEVFEAGCYCVRYWWD